MTRRDFNDILVNHTFIANSPAFEINFFVELSFGQTWVDDGYLQITVRNVDFQNRSQVPNISIAN